MSGPLTMREVAHYNGGREWFGYKYQCIQHPRLSRFDRYTRRDRSVASTWRVDGQECRSFEEAMAELDHAPALTVSELTAIAQFDKATMRKADFPGFKASYPHLTTLAEKGVVWWDAGKVTLVHEAAMQAVAAAESNASGTLEWDVVSPAVDRARAAIARTKGDVA